MATNRAQRATIWFWLALFVALYVVVSAGLAVATSDACDAGGSLQGSKTWQPFPPHWECS
jgi:hypothetical protein